MNLETSEQLSQLADQLLSRSQAQETEIVLATGEEYLTRFAGNVIHQNVGLRSAGATVRVVNGKRIGVAESEGLDPQMLLRTLEQAQEIAAVRPPLEDFKRLPGPRKTRPVAAFDEATANFSPDQRAAIVEELVTASRRQSAEAAGLVQTQAGAMFVANSRGVRAYHRSTSAEFQTVVTCGDGSGYAESLAHAVAELDVARVINDAIDKAARSREPAPLGPGEYDVILEPAAVGSLLEMLGYVGFGAKSYQEGRSFMSGKIGEKITGEAITIVDNAYDPKQLGMPFDFEGVPRKKVSLIENGVAAGVVFDSYLAGREKERRPSTGHALPPKYAGYGALPLNLVMKGGDRTLKQLIAGTERGLLITRFHYVNIVEPMKMVLTGMTRDGTFRIENGRLAGPVRNLRFTEGVLEAFERADGLTRERRVVEGPILCPAMKIRGFRFTGSTEF